MTETDRKAVETLSQARHEMSQAAFLGTHLEYSAAILEQLKQRGYQILPIVTDEKQSLDCAKLRVAVARVKDYTYQTEAERDENKQQQDINTIEAALAELEQLRAASEWQKIETAPVRTRILLRNEKDVWVLPATIELEDGEYIIWETYSQNQVDYSPDLQWKPETLPTPPKEVG